MKRSIAFLLIFNLLALSASLYAKKKGTELEILKKDGQQVRGELIAVKQNSLLLKESKKGADESVEVNNVEKIKIVKNSKAGTGALIGGIIGFAGGAALGYASEQSEYGDVVHASTILYAGVFFGTVCTLAGTLVGIPLGIDETIQIAGKSDSEINKILEDLRKKARAPEYQR